MLVALIVGSPCAVALAIWHYMGYFNGRYDRWSDQQAS